ncbi:MAG: GNAT family N-acetyltransferase [Tissierellia bacterium]|nr:GNAT family N-acetyltransferase [Tissierellia bacterium]
MNDKIRFGKEYDRKAITELLAKGFPEQWKALSKKKKKVMEIIEGGIHPENFVLCEEDGDIIAVLGFNDGKSFPVTVDKRALWRNYFILAPIFGYFMEKEFAMSHLANTDILHLSFFTVDSDVRGRGKGREFFQKALELLDKEYYVFDVVKESLLPFYESMGFRIIKRKKIPFSFIYHYKYRYIMVGTGKVKTRS